MTEVPEHILAQVHRLAADGEPVERIAFLLRLNREVVEAELQNPTVPSSSTVNTTDGESTVRLSYVGVPSR